MPKKIREKQVVANPKVIIDSFTNNLESIRVFVSNVEPLVIAYDEHVSKKMENVKSGIKEIIASSDIVTANVNNIPTKIEIPKERVEKTVEGIINVLMDYKKLPRITMAQVELLYKSSFVMLISFFDYLLYDIIHCYYKMYPERLPDKDLSIHLSELKLCADRDEAIDVILNNKVDSIIGEGLRKQKLFFKNTLQIDLKAKIINWDIINEAVERRNIVVHNNSLVNRRYLRNVNFSVVPEKRTEIKEGKKLNVTAEYFKRAYDEILLAGVVLIQSCWRKWMKDDLDNADRSLRNSIFELLLRAEWSVAERIGFFSKDIKVYDAESRYILDINYCQSLKWQGKKAELSKELSRFDESTLSPRFRVALSALKSDKDGFYKHIEKAIAIEEMTEEDFYDWPLFRELRQDVEYEERIKKAFSKKNKAVKND